MHCSWNLLLSCAYTNEITFAPLQTSTRDGDPAVDTKVQWHQSCSPRSMYSLTASVGISCEVNVPDFDMLNSWGSKISRSTR